MLDLLAIIILIIFCVVGFLAIFFTTIGTFIILIGAFIYALLTGFFSMDVRVLLILLALYLVGEVIETFLVILGAKKFGATNAAVVGAIVGGILGALLGAAFLGVGLLLGTFLGIFGGAFLVEWLIHRDMVRSLKAGAGSLIGRIGAIAAKVLIAFVMLYFIFASVIASFFESPKNTEMTWTQIYEELHNKYPTLQQITVDELHNWLSDPSRDDKPYIYDVRRLDEYNVSHLKDAVHLPPTSNIAAVFENIPKDRPIVVYCSVGYRSSYVAEELVTLGFSNVRHLEGSIFAWANADYPLVADGEQAHKVHGFNPYWGNLLEPDKRN